MTVTAMDDPVGWVGALPAGDPVRLRVLQALARRAALQPPGALRERLVQVLLTRAQAAPNDTVAVTAAPRANPLAELLARLQEDAGPELRNVQLHRRTWSELRLARRMEDVRAPVPEHLGPLNNQVLVRRALQQLQGLSPDYLQRLLAQLDGLAALVPLQASVPAEPKPASKSVSKAPMKPSASSARKPGSRKR